MGHSEAGWRGYDLESGRGRRGQFQDTALRARKRAECQHLAPLEPGETLDHSMPRPGQAIDADQIELGFAGPIPRCERARDVTADEPTRRQ